MERGDNMSDILLRLSGPKVFDVILERNGPFVEETRDVIGIVQYCSDKVWFFRSYIKNGADMNGVLEILRALNGA